MGKEGIMPRYYFHLMSPTNPVRDRTGVELPGLTAAHWHAVRLVYPCGPTRLRPARTGCSRSPTSQARSRSYCCHARCRCSARRPSRHSLGGPLSNLGEGPGEGMRRQVGSRIPLTFLLVLNSSEVDGFPLLS